jgi:hypothetical protein
MTIDVAPAYNPDEVLAAIEKGVCCKDDLPKLVKRVYGIDD